MASDDMAHLRERIRDFVARRDWEQFHTPKNLAMALGAEVGELLALLQWRRPDESPDTEAAADEVADVLIYLLLLADSLGIDPVAAAMAKVERNEHRFPEDDVRGRA